MKASSFAVSNEVHAIGSQSKVSVSERKLDMINNRTHCHRVFHN